MNEHNSFCCQWLWRLTLVVITANFRPKGQARRSACGDQDSKCSKPNLIGSMAFHKVKLDHS
jgi:hypothetical protein